VQPAQAAFAGLPSSTKQLGGRYQLYGLMCTLEGLQHHHQQRAVALLHLVVAVEADGGQE
jgi:hypothetical protein